MSKELTHIGMVQKSQYGDPVGDPVLTMLRGTKKRWYSGDARHGSWWRREAETTGSEWTINGNPDELSRTFYHLDLSSVRPMTVAELRGPLAFEVVRRQGLLNDAQQKVREAETHLCDALTPLIAFDKKHGWTEGSP